MRQKIWKNHRGESFEGWMLQVGEVKRTSTRRGDRSDRRNEIDGEMRVRLS